MAFNWGELWNFLPSVVSAASGLLGVWMGGRLTWKREETREKTQREKDTNYLAVLAVAHLDRFVSRCVDVAGDDGTREGRPAGDGGIYWQATTNVPEFDPLSLNVDWKVLPANLMYGVLNLPHRVEQLCEEIGAIREFDDPPEFTETFWTRQQRFGELGLEVSDLARQLREYARLPPDEYRLGTWDRDEYLREKVDEITRKRSAYEARVAARMPV